MTETWTILKMLAWCTDFFSKKGIDSSRLDAELLLSHSLGLKRLDLYLQFERPLTEIELKNFKALLLRRAEREPLAYITGQKEFWSLTFKSRSPILIPRPDTELVIEVVKKKISPQSILDIGTGSGVLAVTLAREFSESKVVAIDILDEALSLAKENAQNLNVSDRIDLRKCDFLKEEVGGAFDLIVSNPPYIRKDEIKSLAPEIVKFESPLALDGGDDGLDFYRIISERAKKMLTPEGFVVVEIGDDQGGVVKDLFLKAGFKNVEVAKDYAGHDRVMSAQHG